MAEEVGFEPTLLPNENVNRFRKIGKLTLFRPIKVHIPPLSLDHEFGDAHFQFALADGRICELSPCSEFEFREFRDFVVRHPPLLFEFRGVFDRDICEEGAPGFCYIGRSHGWPDFLSHKLTVREVSV